MKVISELAARIWVRLPGRLRLRVIRLSQHKFTASVAAVVVNEQGEVLLLDHILRPFSSWGLPGGFIDRGEDPETAIRREVLEETGLRLEGLHMLRVRTLGRHLEILFEARTKGEAAVLSREIRDLGWFRTENMPNQMSSAQKSIIRDVLGRWR